MGSPTKWNAYLSKVAAVFKTVGLGLLTFFATPATLIAQNESIDRRSRSRRHVKKSFIY
jgi:hypothetical protein